MAGKTRVEGLDRLRKKAAAIPKAARAEIRKALEKGAIEVSSLAKQFAPVLTGELKESIGYTFGQYTPDNHRVRGVETGAGGLGDPDLTVTIHAGDEKAWYAALVEFGTKPHPAGGIFEGAQHPGTEAQPFMGPAYRLLKKRIKGRINRATKKAARDVANGTLR